MNEININQDQIIIQSIVIHIPGFWNICLGGDKKLFLKDIFEVLLLRHFFWAIQISNGFFYQQGFIVLFTNVSMRRFKGKDYFIPKFVF